MFGNQDDECGYSLIYWQHSTFASRARNCRVPPLIKVADILVTLGYFGNLGVRSVFGLLV